MHAIFRMSGCLFKNSAKAKRLNRFKFGHYLYFRSYSQIFLIGYFYENILSEQ